jgi:hypothetical protein
MGEALRRAALLAVLGGAVAALALTASPSQRARNVTHDELPVFVETRNGTLVGIDYHVGDARPERLADTLAVFAQGGAPRDLLPPSLQRLANLMSEPGYELESAGARLLVVSGEHRLYGVPMRNGSVCIFRETRAGTNCVPSLLHGAYAQIEPGWRSRRGYVWGLADNEADSVRVQLSTGWLAAKLGRNGFYLELPRGAVAPRRIVVRERTGVRHVYDVKRCRRAGAFLFGGPVGPLPC